MGSIQTKVSYKTKGILEIFSWHISLKNFTTFKCSDIAKLSPSPDSPCLDQSTYESTYPLPFSLLETDNQVDLTNLQISLLLICNDDQGNRIDLFKSLTADPEQLIHFFRWKYELIYSRIPRYLMEMKLLDPVAAADFIKRKHEKIWDMSNMRYHQYTTSTCNVLKLTMLKR